MQDTEMFLSLAEIAGVFVGFGALIAVRSGGPTEAGDITGIRWVMSTVGLFVMVFERRRPPTAADPAALPAPGGWNS